MDLKECKESGFVKSVQEDRPLINSLIIDSKNRLVSAEKIPLDGAACSSIITLTYDALRELLEAIALKRGFKIYNHECYRSFLIEVLKQDGLGMEFDKIRKIRNSINYYGEEINLKEAKEIILKIRSLIKDLHQYL